MKYSVYVSVNLCHAERSAEDYWRLWHIANHRVEGVARRVGGLDPTGGGSGSGRRELDFECDDRTCAERLVARLGDRIVAHLGPKEIDLPVRSQIVEIPMVQVFEARPDPRRDGRLEWEFRGEIEAYLETDPSDAVAVLRVSNKLLTSEVVTSLRTLADEIEAHARRQP